MHALRLLKRSKASERGPRRRAYRGTERGGRRYRGYSLPPSPVLLQCKCASPLPTPHNSSNACVGFLPRWAAWGRVALKAFDGNDGDADGDGDGDVVTLQSQLVKSCSTSPRPCLSTRQSYQCCVVLANYAYTRRCPTATVHVCVCVIMFMRAA